MKTKEEIKQQVAELNGEKSWNQLMHNKNISAFFINEYFDLVLDLYAAQLHTKVLNINVQEVILDIIRKNYNEYAGVNEAELHMAEDISDYVNAVVRCETDKLRPIKLTKDNVPEGEVICFSENNCFISPIYYIYKLDFGIGYLSGSIFPHCVTHFMYKPEITD